MAIAIAVKEPTEKPWGQIVSYVRDLNRNAMKTTKPKIELMALKNVGPATYQDLIKLGITNIPELAKADPDELYIRIQEITGQKHDPCVWDVFAAIIHEAKTGIKEPWWQWTAVRKDRQRHGTWVKSQLQLP